MALAPTSTISLKMSAPREILPTTASWRGTLLEENLVDKDKIL